jgi:hypothetical protein
VAISSARTQVLKIAQPRTGQSVRGLLGKELADAAEIMRPRVPVARRRTRIASREPDPPKNRPYYNLPGHAHERTFSCCRRLPLWNRDRSREWLLDALRSNMPERNEVISRADCQGVR